MRRRLSLLGLLIAGCATLLGGTWAPAARAGSWIQVSCVNPDGSTAPSEGWSTGTSGSPPAAAFASARCAAGTPMQADLFNGQVAPNPAEELLQYTPPAGSTLAGGTLQVGLYADGYGSGSNSYTWGSAGVLEPGPAFTTANVVKRCVQSQHLCQNGTDDYVGPVSLPANAGGDLYVEADCNGFNTSGHCDTGGSHDAWALAQVDSAQLLLHNDASPAGAGFSGPILRPRASGLAALGFTATDPGGPGVYSVTVAVDGRSVYSGTPDTNDGACVPVGRDASSGALMFDYQQPCPASEPVLVAVPTSSFRDGRHTLTATVTDAAGNANVVLDQGITVRNTGSTPTRLPRLHLRLVLYWHWDAVHTKLLRIAVQRAPRGARLAVSCRGRGCPGAAVVARRRLRGRRTLKQVLRALAGVSYRAGDHVTLSFSAPHRAPERIVLAIRSNRLPAGRRVR